MLFFDYKQASSSGSLLFQNILQAIGDVARNPGQESHVRTMIQVLFESLAFRDAPHNLALRMGTNISVLTSCNMSFRAQPEILIEQVNTPVGSIAALVLEAKVLNCESSGRVLGEILTSAMFNFHTGAPFRSVIAVYINGLFIRFISFFASERYLRGLESGSLGGVDTPTVYVWPPHNIALHRHQQGFNLATSEGRRDALLVLANIRHYFISSCSSN